MEPLNPAAITPADMLACYDKSMRGEPLTITEKAVVNRLVKAAAFASQAYERGIDPDQATHAMLRALLCTLVTPLHPDLDYLRAVPASGPTARKRDSIAND